MSRLAWILVALCALSCNASVSARPVRDPASIPVATVTDPFPLPPTVPALSPEFVKRERGGPKKPPALLQPLDGSGDVLLCCDRPTGICYHDSGEMCTAHTSQLVSCPAVAVREFDAAHGFVMCVD